MPAKKKIYSIAASHLDTSWLWTLETSIDEYIPNTLFRNFRLFEKYPDYTFGWEGSYRYELMEEYYPEAFLKLKEYVAARRWVPTGSSYENGDVNMPSPEALFRNILYGSRYFDEKFGTPSNDIFLPDCFGFGYALPSIAAHAGLKGFSTGKLTWGGAYGRPFDIGKWYGVDGNYIYANIKPSSYSRTVKTIRGDKAVYPKLKENEPFGLPLTATFYGTGDRGGAPSESSVKAVCDEIKTNDSSDIEVLSASSTQLFEDLAALPEEIQSQMPSWNNELLLTNHGVGSYTSRSCGTRWNKNCERLADCAERSAAAAAYLTDYQYPEFVFDTAWKRFIAHQFHDDITGTSFMECYLRNWNDYMLSQKQFANEYTGAVKAVADKLDTSFAKGTPVVVSNTLQFARTAVVDADIALPEGTKHVAVYDKDGKELPAQLLKTDDTTRVKFIGTVPALGYAVFDVRPSLSARVVETPLKVGGFTLENDFVRVLLNSSGDICEIFDKKLQKNILKDPIRLAVFDYKGSKAWPAWELTYKELCVPPKEYAKNAKVSLLEVGPAQASFKVTRKAGASSFTQIVSLDAYSPVITVKSEADWRSTQSLLKVEFPLSADNCLASYDIGLGVIQRQNNAPNLYEVPAQIWADITDEKNEFGVALFSDSRCGWDKPDNNTLRLTVVHTPYYSYRWECSQHLMDLGLNRFAFAVCPHAGAVSADVQNAAQSFNTPLMPFVTDVHKGALGREYSFGGVSDDGVILRAVKKEYQGDRIVVRLNEGEGKAKRNVRLNLGDGIVSAAELDGCERELCAAKVENGELVFDMTPYGIKTFALTLKKKEAPQSAMLQTSLMIPCNATIITSNANRAEGGIEGGYSIPEELLPGTITCGGIHFVTVRDGAYGQNGLLCDNQTLYLPKDAKKLYLLAFSAGGDRTVTFKIDGKPYDLTIADCFEHVGSWDMIGLGQTGFIKKDTFAWNATHTHSKTGDVTAKQLYTFVYELPVSGASKVNMPVNRGVVILAATVSFEDRVFRAAKELFDQLEKRPFDYQLTPDEVKKARPAQLEQAAQLFLKRRKTFTVNLPQINGVFQVADAFALVRQGIQAIKK